MVVWLLCILIFASYMLGNINFARIVTRFRQINLEKVGSGNPGATNVLRNVGFKLGMVTMVLDAIKGALAALAGYYACLWTGGALFPDCVIWLYACGAAVVVGHIFPVIYKFKGGKGIAACIGLFAVAQPIPLLIAFAVLFTLLIIFRYVSILALIGVTAMIIVENLMHAFNLAISLITYGIFLLVWFAHRANIVRLLVGKENELSIQKAIEKDRLRRLKKENKEHVQP